MLDFFWAIAKTVFTIIGMVVSFLILGKRAKLVRIKDTNGVPLVDHCYGTLK